MKIKVISIGREKEPYFKDIWVDYSNRISRYFLFEWVFIPNDTVEKEGEKILKTVSKEDYLICLDEKGKELSTIDLKELFEKRLIQSSKQIVFVIGGSYGLDDMVRSRADFIWSLSKLTLPHLLVRVLLSESIYRAISIIKNEPYHHA